MGRLNIISLVVFWVLLLGWLLNSCVTEFVADWNEPRPVKAKFINIGYTTDDGQYCPALITSKIPPKNSARRKTWLLCHYVNRLHEVYGLEEEFRPWFTVDIKNTPDARGHHGVRTYSCGAVLKTGLGNLLGGVKDYYVTSKHLEYCKFQRDKAIRKKKHDLKKRSSSYFSVTPAYAEPQRPTAKRRINYNGWIRYADTWFGSVYCPEAALGGNSIDHKVCRETAWILKHYYKYNSLNILNKTKNINCNLVLRFMVKSGRWTPDKVKSCRFLLAFILEDRKKALLKKDRKDQEWRISKAHKAAAFEKTGMRNALIFSIVFAVVGFCWGFLFELGKKSLSAADLDDDRITTAFKLSGLFALSSFWLSLMDIQQGASILFKLFVLIPALAFLFTTLVVIPYTILSVLKGLLKWLHFAFSSHPAEPVVRQSQVLEPLDTGALSNVLRGRREHVPGFWATLFKPKFVSQHEAHHAQQVKEMLDADAEIATAAVQRERAVAGFQDTKNRLASPEALAYSIDVSLAYEALVDAIEDVIGTNNLTDHEINELMEVLEYRAKEPNLTKNEKRRVLSYVAYRRELNER